MVAGPSDVGASNLGSHPLGNKAALMGGAVRATIDAAEATRRARGGGTGWLSHQSTASSARAVLEYGRRGPDVVQGRDASLTSCRGAVLEPCTRDASRASVSHA